MRKKATGGKRPVFEGFLMQALELNGLSHGQKAEGLKDA